MIFNFKSGIILSCDPHLYMLTYSMHQHDKLGKSGGMLPVKSFENACSEMASGSYFTYSLFLFLSIPRIYFVLLYQLIQFHNQFLASS